MEEKLIITKWNQNQFLKLFCCRDSALNITCLRAFLLRLRSFFFLRLYSSRFIVQPKLRIILPLQGKMNRHSDTEEEKKRLKGAWATIEQTIQRFVEVFKYTYNCILASNTRAIATHLNRIRIPLCKNCIIFRCKRANVGIYFTAWNQK